MSYRARRMLATLALAATSGTVWSGTAAAENRMALIIGNSAYETVTALPNPANDAKAMAELLTAAGFEVISAPNLAQSEMRQAVSNFAGIVAGKGPDTVALLFYAGHGLQVDGENFLVPIDARIQREADVPLQAMRLADVMNTLAAVPSKTRIVIIPLRPEPRRRTATARTARSQRRSSRLAASRACRSSRRSSACAIWCTMRPSSSRPHGKAHR
jgi:hypothetical protein